MFIWFAVLSVLMVAVVFRSPAVDHRTVMLGALLPLGEAALGGPRLAHSVVGAVALLGMVMAATSHRRRLRRQLLGVPIGIMCHLVLDFSFTHTHGFWWPLFGVRFASGQIPELTRPALSLVLELAGLGVGWWCWKLFGLDDPSARRRFLTEGRLQLPA